MKKEIRIFLKGMIKGIKEVWQDIFKKKEKDEFGCGRC